MATKGRVIDSMEALTAAHGEAVALLDTDPAAAIALAESCIPGSGHEDNVQQLQAAMYTDGGVQLNRADLVKRGAEMWRALSPGTTPNIAYNLANAELGIFQAATAATDDLAAAWSENVSHLQKARALFRRVAKDAASPRNLRLQALTNAGNAFDIVGRYLDAIDLYDEALALDPGFAMALGNRGVALEHSARLMRGHAPTVLSEAVANLDAALAQPDAVGGFGGRSAVDVFAKVRQRIKCPPSSGPDPQVKKPWADPHADWCRRHELFLHVSHRCLHENTERLDPLFFRGVTIGLDDASQHRVRQFVDAFDAIKQDYVAARYTAWLASERTSPIRAHSAAISARVTFRDRLEYARWGVRTGMAVQALAAATNVLDKVASFVHLYLSTARKVQSVYFEWLWQARDKPMDEQIAVLLKRPNVNRGLLALFDLSYDLRSDTPLARRVHLRHTSTHRFLVAHTEVAPPSDDWFDRLKWDELVKESIAQLQVARAALIYLARMIDIAEYRAPKKDPKHPTPSIPIPSADSRLSEHD